ncbi:homoserine acetyltransferase [Auritidibacter ignavus]|nr:homoserine acetyltransferase [Auritidibacter ignavus]
MLKHAWPTRWGIETWHAVLGGSMGGARALEWAAPTRNESGVRVF